MAIILFHAWNHRSNNFFFILVIFFHQIKGTVLALILVLFWKMPLDKFIKFTTKFWEKGSKLINFTEKFLEKLYAIHNRPIGLVNKTLMVSFFFKKTFIFTTKVGLRINDAQKNGPHWRKTAIELISWNLGITFEVKFFIGALNHVIDYVEFHSIL